MNKKFDSAMKKIFHENKEVYDSLAREEKARQKITIKK